MRVRGGARACASYLIGPGILVPGSELQHPDDLVDFGGHLLEGEVAVLQRLLNPVALGCLGGHEDLDSYVRVCV